MAATGLIRVLEPEILRPVCPKCLTEVPKGERKNRLKMHYHCFLQHQLNVAKAKLRAFEKRRGIRRKL